MSCICIFSALYLPNMGGVERFTDSLAAELAAEGHSVIVVTNNTHGLSNREVLDNGVEVIRFPCKSLIDGRYPVPIKNACYRSLMADLESRYVDGVLVNTRFYLHSLIGVQFAERMGLRAVVLDHGSAYLTLGSKPLDWVIERYEDGITAWLKRRDVDFYGISKKSVEWLGHFGIEAKGVISNAIDVEAYRGQASGRQFKRRDVDFYGISKKSVEWLGHFGIEAKGVISNAIDVEAYRGQASGRQFRKELGVEDGLLVSFVGRLIPEKGIDALLEIMGSLQDRSVHLAVAGDGPLFDQVDTSPLPNVHALGRLNSSDTAALLMDSDLFCLPTRSEGFSTSLLEAASCGTVSLVPDVGGAREIIPNDSFGFVSERVDVNKYAEIIRSVDDGKFDLKAMGIKCRLHVEKLLSWSDVAACVVDACNLSGTHR